MTGALRARALFLAAVTALVASVVTGGLAATQAGRGVAAATPSIVGPGGVRVGGLLRARVAEWQRAFLVHGGHGRDAHGDRPLHCAPAGPEGGGRGRVPQRRDRAGDDSDCHDARRDVSRRRRAPVCSSAGVRRPRRRRRAGVPPRDRRRDWNGLPRTVRRGVRLPGRSPRAARCGAFRVPAGRGLRCRCGSSVLARSFTCWRLLPTTRPSTRRC